MSAFTLIPYAIGQPQATKSKALTILFRKELRTAVQPSERDWQGDFEAGYRTVMQRSHTQPYVLTSFCTCPSSQPICKHAVALMMHFSMLDYPKDRLPQDAVIARWMAVQTSHQVASSQGIGRDAHDYTEAHVITLGWEAMTAAEFELNNSGPDFAGQMALGIIWFILEKWPLILGYGNGLELMGQFSAFMRAVAAYPAAKRETLNHLSRHLLTIDVPDVKSGQMLRESLNLFVTE